MPDPIQLRPDQTMSPGEWRMRLDLAAAYRLVAHYGWDDLTATHLSARIPGPEHHFLLNPYGMMFHEITASSLVKVDLDGAILAGEYPVNAAGFTIHSAVHAAREDAIAVMHLHTVAGMAVSAQEEGLLPLTQTAMILLNRLAYHEYEGVAFNHDERPRLVADLGDKTAMILRNHGTLTLGRSVAEAFNAMYHLEKACAAQVAALTGKVRLPPAEALETVAQQIAARQRKDMASTLVWPALLRLVDAKYPDYAT